MEKQKYVLGNYVDFSEDLQNEFKEFYLKLDISSFLTFEEIKHMVTSGEVCRGFNEIMFSNLKQYINVYLPKYISTFANTEEISEGHFYIGINDFGEITGIPFVGDLDEDIIKSFLEHTKPFLSATSSNASLSEDVLIDKLLDSIKVEIIKVEPNTFLLEDECKNEIDEYIYKRNEFKRAYKEYIVKHTAWVEEMLSYASKLVEYVSDPKLRNDIANYIIDSEEYKTIDTTHMIVATAIDGTKYERLCEKSHLDSCVAILKSNVPIPIYDSVRLADIKLDPKNVLYWVMIYKDYMTQIIRQRRPIKPCDTFYNEELFYNNMLRFISKMRYKFLKNYEDSPVSQKLNYYVIKFIIPGNVGHEFFYSNLNSELRWIKKVRGYIGDSVGCL